LIRIPVWYGGAVGPDLEYLAGRVGLTEEEVIKRHSDVEYLVYLLGFLPGFPYLGGMDPSIALPRRAQPRTRVPRGSVGIGGSQTGIYPLDSPGGWHLIGRTPISLFEPDKDEPTLLRPGDRVRFVAISEAEFLELGGHV
jgi:KipI family sensor histidine kinase inhibitor